MVIDVPSVVPDAGEGESEMSTIVLGNICEFFPSISLQKKHKNKKIKTVFNNIIKIYKNKYNLFYTTVLEFILQ